jgi:hypothetical protein
MVLWSGGQTSVVADTSGEISSFILAKGQPPTGTQAFPSINAHGVAAFGAELKNGSEAIFTSDNGVLTKVIDSGRTPDSQIFRMAKINDAGTIAFIGGGSDIRTQGPFILDAGNVRTVDPRRHEYFQAIDINNAGQVIYDFIATDLVGFMYISDGHGVTQVTSSAIDVNAVVLNDLSQIAIGMGKDRIARVANGLLDHVVQAGDSLFGSSVSDVFFSREGFNDEEQIAFIAALADGRTVVVRADPVAEPGVGALCLGALVALHLRLRAPPVSDRTPIDHS